MPDVMEEPPQGLIVGPAMRGKFLLTPNEVAYLLSIGRTAVFQLMKQKQLFSVKIGGARRIPTDTVHRFVAGLLAQED
jgi:excisionase family DNA binding protein